MATFIVNTGLAMVMNRMRASGQVEPLFASWGTGAGTTLASDTTLFTEVGNAGGAGRVTGVSTSQTTTVAGDTYQVIATLTASGAITVTNAGLFDLVALNAGNCFMKGDFTGIALQAADALQLTFRMIGASA